MLQIATRKQLTSSPDEEVAINIQSDSIVRQTNKVHLTPWWTITTYFITSLTLENNDLKIGTSAEINKVGYRWKKVEKIHWWQMLGPLQRKQGDFQEHVYTYSHKEKSKLRKKNRWSHRTWYHFARSSKSIWYSLML